MVAQRLFDPPDGTARSGPAPACGGVLLCILTLSLLSIFPYHKTLSLCLPNGGQCELDFLGEYANSRVSPLIIKLVLLCMILDVTLNPTQSSHADMFVILLYVLRHASVCVWRSARRAPCRPPLKPSLIAGMGLAALGRWLPLPTTGSVEWAWLTTLASEVSGSLGDPGTWTLGTSSLPDTDAWALPSVLGACEML